MDGRNEKKCKQGVRVFGFILGIVRLLLVGVVLYLICAILVGIFAPTEYVSEKRYIYDLWHNHYYEERQHPNPAIKSTKEINRYHYKVKSGNTYSERWTSYDISDITVIPNQKHEYIVIDRLYYQHGTFNKMYKASSSRDMPETKAHYFIHKDTAQKIGITVD